MRAGEAVPPSGRGVAVGDCRSGRVCRTISASTAFRPRVSTTVHPIEIRSGYDEPLLLEPVSGTEVVECAGPEGMSGDAARALAGDAVAAPADGPPLEAHMVPGDRAVVAVAGVVPQAEAVLAAITERLRIAGVEAADTTALCAEPLEPLRPGPRPQAPTPAGFGEVAMFDPANEAATAYLVADESGNPLYLARGLVDADVVVAVGVWGWNAALGGRSLEGELWPAFGRRKCRLDLVRAARPPWPPCTRRLADGHAGDHLATGGLREPASRARPPRHAASGVFRSSRVGRTPGTGRRRGLVPAGR